MLKVFRVFSSKLGALLSVGQAGSFHKLSLVYLTLSLPWLMELQAQPHLQTVSGVSSRSQAYLPGAWQVGLASGKEELQNFERSYLCS